MTPPSPLHYTNVYNRSNFALLSYIRLGGGTVSRYSINFPVTPTSYSQRLRFIFIDSNVRHLCAHADCLLPSYLLIPWNGALLKKLTGSQLVKKFPAFYGTRRFITSVTSVRQLSLSWASSIQSAPPHLTSWRSIFYCPQYETNTGHTRVIRERKYACITVVSF